MLNIFTNDAFGLVTLSAVINSVDYVPGRAGELVFSGVAEPMATTSAAIESTGYTLSLVKSSKRGSPAAKQDTDKGKIASVAVPHFKIEDTIEASSIQDVRQLGSSDALRSARSVIDRQITKMTSRLDFTLENLRLGALRGVVLDSDATTLLDLYALFGVSAPAAFDFGAALSSVNPTDPEDQFRAMCQQVVRYMKRNVKAPWPSTARVWAFCGDNFFDRLVNSIGVKEYSQATALAKITLTTNYAFGVFEFADIVWENYQGSDDASTITVAANDCRFFVVGIPGLYIEYYAPGTFFESVNTIALPRYAKIAPDNRFNESVEVHVQTNPLPICTRPLTLVRGHI